MRKGEGLGNKDRTKVRLQDVLWARGLGKRHRGLQGTCRGPAARNSIALDGWTSQNRLAITLVILYYILKNWTLEEVQIAFEEVR